MLLQPFKNAWQGKDPFAEAAGLTGKIYRHKEGRRTLQFEFEGKSYFIKHHAGIGWKEIFKNLLQLRLPVLGASNEFYSANKLTLQGVQTLTPMAYGKRGLNPARQESFIITEDLIDTLSLEELGLQWQRQGKSPAFSLKQFLLKTVASTAKIMHENGINHRDFYICHFLVDKNIEEKIAAKQAVSCRLIDLHRCQIRDKVPRRWLIKDLAGLFYSAMDVGLTQRDLLRFIKHYTGESLRCSLRNPLWDRVHAKAVQLYQNF